ncbi:MAG: septal ring lytic transglycosylase RlpA family protein [Brachymonas sp.]|nr:septal ring lytic transglycosylase RlpA family protein [Brachymonas sp.]
MKNTTSISALAGVTSGKACAIAVLSAGLCATPVVVAKGRSHLPATVQTASTQFSAPSAADGAKAAEQMPLGKPTTLHMPADEALQASFQQGTASWYGPGFHNRLTANGERYNMDALTAAHRTLPFGTMVLVKNAANGKTVTVRINDRGPFIKGRIIDLSRAAARQLGFSGVQRVVLYKTQGGKVQKLAPAKVRKTDLAPAAEAAPALVSSNN